MNFLYLSPHFPPNFVQFVMRLRDQGVNVLGLGDAPYSALGDEVAQALTEYFAVSDMHDYEQVLRAVGYLTWRHGRIDRVESHAEYWLELEARIRTDFNIYGVHNDTIALIKRKSAMKRLFREAGVDVPRGGIVHTIVEAERLVEETGFPVVAKPDIGVGAAGTAKLYNSAQLRTFFATKPPVDYMLEEFVQGSLHSFDGLTNRHGDIVFWTSHNFSRGVMEVVNDDEDIYYYSLRDLPEDLEQAGRAAVRQFGLRERFFHIEFFRRDGRLMALEVNMRPPGGLTTDMFNYANNFDIYAGWANVVTRDHFNQPWSRPYHAAYAGRKGHKQYLHSHEEVLARCGPLLVHHERIPDIFSRALGQHGYVFRHPDLKNIIDAAEYILEER